MADTEKEVLQSDISSESDLGENEREPKLYELGYHIIPIVPEDELGAEVSRIKDIVETHGGVFATDEMPKRVELAYPIAFVPALKRGAETRKVYHSAYFGWMRFNIRPVDADALGRKLRENEKILRFLLVKTTQEKIMLPASMMFTKEEKSTPKTSTARTRSKEVKRETLSEEELDKTIQELIVE